MKTALDIAAPYPGTMGQGIDGWLTATKEAGQEVEVLFREQRPHLHH